MTIVPNSMDEVAALMRENLPPDIGLAEFGRRMDWGRGDAAAESRIGTLTQEELQAMGLTADQANCWAVAYEAVQQLMPDNPSARGRAKLMRHATQLLTEEG